MGAISNTGTDPLRPANRPELVFGVIGPVGTDRSAFCNDLITELGQYNYAAHRIRVSGLLDGLPGLTSLENETETGDEFKRIEAYMTAGTQVREMTGRSEALALLAIAEIRRLRSVLNSERASEFSFDSEVSGDDRWIESTAYILDSIKHPSEIETLKAIYGRAFIVISIYTPRADRAEILASRIAKSRYIASKNTNCEIDAEKLISRDEEEGKKHGQNVRKVFPKADFFLNFSNKAARKADLERFLKLVFNNPFVTPTSEERAMFAAESYSWRSADLSRQVGAVVTSQAGELLAFGCNEVPKFGGEYYSDGDQDDARDLARNVDSGTAQKQLMVAELLERVLETGKFEISGRDGLKSLISQVQSGEIPKSLDNLQALNIIEFGRAVHAEMATLCDAAKRGLSVQGGSLYVNTFPCHICARHIIAAGITKVVYIEPYPKSLTGQLYKEQIDLDGVKGNQVDKVKFEPFCGVAPTVYQFLFKVIAKRKNSAGEQSHWVKASATPKLKRYVMSYIAIEQQVVGKIIPNMKKSMDKSQEVATNGV